MNAYSFILTSILLCKAIALEGHNIYYDVGTVLFSPLDLNKGHWNNKEIVLLRARKRFLSVIPPPSVINTQTDDFARTIVDYFKEIYATVKRETSDPETYNILMAALSDTLGGYIKMWILPMVQLGYYGGTVPEDQALRFFNFYDDIKSYLDTDGKSWHKPVKRYLRSMSINIAPCKEHSREIQNACDALSYFKKTNTGFEIPIPKVIWNDGKDIMFIPLKNESVFPLDSPNSANYLFKYYNTAKRCIRSSNIDNEQKYDERLQNWILLDIIPHLSDEKLYPALRSVLSLLNASQGLVECVTTTTTGTVKPKSNFCVMGVPIDFSSKKMMIISVIIIIEVVWCIPTLCYLLCVRRKKKHNATNSDIYFYVEPNKSKNKSEWADSTQHTTITDKHNNLSKNSSTTDTKRSSEPSHSSQTRSLKNKTLFSTQSIAKNASIHSMGTGTRCNFKNQTSFISHNDNQPMRHRTSSGTIVEVIPDTQSSSSKTSSVESLETTSPSISFKAEEIKTASFVTVQERLKPNRKVTILSENPSYVTEIFNYIDEINTTNKPEKKRCLKYAVMPEDKQNMQNNKKTAKSILKPSDHNLSQTKSSVIKKALRQNSSQPFLEIVIDRPQRDLSVGIVENVRVTRPSKIPKRFFTSCITQTHDLPHKEKDQNRRSGSEGGKSLIPQLKKPNVQDDISIDAKKPSKDKKLNSTL